MIVNGLNLYEPNVCDVCEMLPALSYVNNESGKTEIALCKIHWMELINDGFARSIEDAKHLRATDQFFDKIMYVEIT
jgi:hypothetical protein